MLNELLNNPEFKGVVDSIKAELTSVVMSQDTLQETRDAALREFHLLDHLVVKIAAGTINKPKD